MAPCPPASTSHKGYSSPPSPLSATWSPPSSLHSPSPSPSPSLSPVPPQSPPSPQSSENNASNYNCPIPFPYRASLPLSDSSSIPPSSVEAYAQSSRWVTWTPSEDGGRGQWLAEWSPSPPSCTDAAHLVDELVRQHLLLDCFSTSCASASDNSATATATVSSFAHGEFNRLFMLRCRCDRENKTVEDDNDTKDPCEDDHKRHRHHDHGRQEDCCSEDCHIGPMPIPTQLLLRLAMPIDPYYKMESEMAAMHFARTQGVPVPMVFMYSSSAASNSLGLEWSLMEKIASPQHLESLEEQLQEAFEARGEQSCSYRYWPEFAQLGTVVADHLQRLQRPVFNKIGGLYWDHAAHVFFIGPPSDPFLAANRRLLYYNDVADSGSDTCSHMSNDDKPCRLTRRPFDTLGEYLDFYLQVWLCEIADPTLRISTADADHDIDSDDDDERWYLPGHIKLITHLVSQLRNIVIPYLASKYHDSATLRTHISHPDLHGANILLLEGAAVHGYSSDASSSASSDASFNTTQDEVIHRLRKRCQLAALLDWEHVLALPAFLIREPSIQDAFPSSDQACAYVPHASKMARDTAWLLQHVGASISFQVTTINEEGSEQRDGDSDDDHHYCTDKAATMFLQQTNGDNDGRGPETSRYVGLQAWPPSSRFAPDYACRRVAGQFAHLVTAQPMRLEVLLALVSSEVRRLGRCDVRAQAWIDELAEAIEAL